MITQQEKYKIKVSDVVWHELKDKVDVIPIQEALNEIDLSKYGTGVEKMHFIFIAAKPTNVVHGDEANYNRKTRTIEVSLRLSYKHVTKANKAEILKMMTGLFLSTVKLYERFNIEDFDLDIFSLDLGKLL